MVPVITYSLLQVGALLEADGDVVKVSTGGDVIFICGRVHEAESPVAVFRAIIKKVSHRQTPLMGAKL